MNPRSSNRLRRKIAWRIYLATMRMEGMFWVKVRRRLLDAMLGRRHAELNVFADVFVNGYEELVLGDNVSLNRGCHISAAGGLRIGNHVSIGHDTSILTSEHGFADAHSPIKNQPVDWAPVAIGDNVWIGARVVILGGVTLPEGTIVGAGSVVTKSVSKPYTTIAGVPAKVIEERELPGGRADGDICRPAASIAG